MNLVPISLIAIMILGALAWDACVGLPLAIPFEHIALIQAPFILLLVALSRKWPQHKSTLEALLYVVLWFTFAFFATTLTYLAVWVGFPMQDAILQRADALIGFRWIDYWRFIGSHPTIYQATLFAYESNIWQPFLLVPILALAKPGTRNPELLTAMALALLITVFVFMLVPAQGPAMLNGMPQDYNRVINSIRSGHPAPLGYYGIVTFPSYHTVMALLFIWSQRGLITFWPVTLLNLVMLFAIPYWGGHYLIDMVGGAFVALAAIGLARRLCAERHGVHGHVKATNPIGPPLEETIR